MINTLSLIWTIGGCLVVLFLLYWSQIAHRMSLDAYTAVACGWMIGIVAWAIALAVTL